MCQYKDCGNERERHHIGVMCQCRDCGNERERDPIGVVWSVNIERKGSHRCGSGDVSI